MKPALRIWLFYYSRIMRHTIIFGAFTIVAYLFLQIISGPVLLTRIISFIPIFLGILFIPCTMFSIYIHYIFYREEFPFYWNLGLSTKLLLLYSFMVNLSLFAICITVYFICK